MKKLGLLFCLIIFGALAAQKKKKENYDDILQTTEIKKIEEFLRTAHPEDPRRTVLKPKLIALKNAAWTKGAKDAKPMAVRPVVAEIPNDVVNRPHSNEAEEFKNLMTEASAAHKQKTVKLLNQLFDNDITNKEAILLVQNNSDCNMVLRISGSKFYNLAVPARGESSMVVEKGDYELNSNICDVQYIAKKEIRKNMMVMLNNPVIKTANPSGNLSFKAQK